MTENYKKLIRTLRQLFEMDKADLDFGIYRIMNQKRDEINNFLEHDLLPQVKDAFTGLDLDGKAELQKELETAVAKAKEFGAPDPENAPAVLAIKKKMTAYVDITAIEQEVYSHLHTFFSRYYDKGDFISKRRYKNDTYAIPYEGEEVKLHWANADQYYIKSSEHLRDYAFTVKIEDEDEDGGKNDQYIRIKLMEADTEKDNTKSQNGERRFVLDAENPLAVVAGELHIHFNYILKPKTTKQEKLNSEAVKTIFAQDGFEDWLEALQHKIPTEKNPNRTLLEKHLNDYTARNTFDYFIHKDLGGFLRRELDFYVKNEVLHLDDIDSGAVVATEQLLRKIQAIRSIAYKIITFLAQLEDFQKKLWLKKKFVVETNYCVTIDRVPEELHEEIIACDAQWQAWVEIGFLGDEIKEEGKRTATLCEHPFLVLDTKFYGAKFKDTLIGQIDDLDKNCDGLLVNSDNFHMLNLLQTRDSNSVQRIYIDPPYNTEQDGFLYKDSYKHSSWMAMLYDRVNLSKLFLSDDGLFASSIDRDENRNYLPLLFHIFTEEGFIEETVWQKSYGGGAKTKHINNLHEYMHIFSLGKKAVPFLEAPPSENVLRYYRLEDDKFQVRGKHRLQPLNTNSNDFRKNLTFPLPTPNLADYGTSSWEKSWKDIGEKLESGKIVLKQDEDEEGVKWSYIKDNGEVWDGNILPPPRQWQWSWEKVKRAIIKDEIVVSQGREGWVVNYKQYRYGENGEERGAKPSSINVGPYTQTGTDELRNLFGYDPIKFPKPVGMVSNFVNIGYKNKYSVYLDYFAGSGTTGHSVIRLNREDNGKRKYILAEMGQYFSSVLKPRIQKVIYSKDWQNGKPKPDTDGNLNGISHCFKYLHLESYEDTLNNLTIQKPSTKQQSLLDVNPELKEDYMLSYCLDVETKDSASLLNLDQFADPFNYQLNIATGSVGATKSTKVDLVETFNYLLGLTVKQIDIIRGFKVVVGQNPQEESVLVVWRVLSEKDNAALEEFMDKSSYHPRDTEFDHIYVNGDHTLEDPRSKVKMTEIEFKRLMFDVQDV